MLSGGDRKNPATALQGLAFLLGHTWVVRAVKTSEVYFWLVEIILSGLSLVTY